MKTLKYFFLFVDIGFILYWVITLFHLIPDEFLFNDYKNSILVNWNWSFFPLDILVSATGIYSVYLHSKGKSNWMFYALFSLIFTSISGLQAIAYWVFAKDFDLSWWLPNLFLLIYPIFFIPTIIQKIKNNGLAS